MSAILSEGRIVAGLRATGALLIAASTMFASGPAAAAVLTVESSDTREAVLSIDLDAPTWAAVPAPGIDGGAWDARLPGFVSSGLPGGARVPRQGGWLVVPPGTSPRVEVLAETWQPLTPRRLAVAPVPVMQYDEATGDVFERPVTPRPGQQLPQDRIPPAVLADMQRTDPALQAGPALRLGDEAWWRGRRIVPYSVLPVRASTDGMATASLASGRWRVRFVPDPQAGKAAPDGAAERLTGAGDDRFAGLLLNGGLLAGLPTEAAHRGRAAVKRDRPAAKGTPIGAPDIRLPVPRTQLYTVRVSELIRDDLIPAGTTVLESQVRLYQRRYLAALDDPLDGQTPPYVEVEVPIHMVGEGDGFDGDDQFLFWGLRLRDDGAFTYDDGEQSWSLGAAGDAQEINNEANIYWLQFADPDAGESWARMATTTLPPSSGSPLASYRRTDYYDEAVAYRENVPSVFSDRYYYNDHLDREARVGLSFWSPVPGQGAASLRAGINNYSTSNRTVLLDLVTGDTPVATLPSFTTNSLYERIYQTGVPADALLADDLDLRMRNSVTVLSLFSFLDWVEVQYDAEYAAPFGRLLFPGGEGAGTHDLEIPGFPSQDFGLIEVSDPRQPQMVALSAANMVDAGETVTLSLQVSQTTSGRRFYAATRMTSTGVADVDYGEASINDPDLAPPSELAEGSADVLVVAHEEFDEITAQWVDYRKSRAGVDGLTFRVVTPQQLYDWYSGGLANPWAIKRWVNHALNAPQWGSWALVLIGDANENPRELGVLSAGREYSRNWVPTHVHVQSAGVGLPPEILGSDEWYANPDAGDDVGFPGTMSEPADLYVGRIPCNSPGDFARLLAKMRQVEEPQPGATWQKRAVFMADDAWSSGTLNAEGYSLVLQDGEDEFEISEARIAEWWRDNGGMVALQADTVWLRPYMTPLHPSDDDTVSLTAARNWCVESGAPQGLIAALSGGGTLAHYQGHANHWLMAHEVWFQHDMRASDAFARRDVWQLTNDGKPWLFCGMGCHLGDFLQNVGHPSGTVEPGLGEKLIFWTDAGAVATYASSGYEYLTSNRDLSEAFGIRMATNPPTMSVDGQASAGRWMLGELLWSAESDMLATSQSSTVRAMVYQYVLLGDPLLFLDGGVPEVDASLAGAGGGPIEGEVELEAIDAGGLRTITMQARDEAGIARLVVTDSRGMDLTDQVIVSETASTAARQIVDYELAVPVRPFDHRIEVHVFDTSDKLETDAHTSFALNIEQSETLVFAADGEILDPATYVFTVGEPVDLEVTFETAAWVDESVVVTLAGENVTVTAPGVTVAGDHTLQVAFTATATEAKAARSVDVSIDGHVTTLVLEAGDAEAPEAGIEGLVNFPNPMGDRTRFVFGTALHGGRGAIRVWTVSGRSVADIPFNVVGNGHEIIEWDGRDREGDQLANGTYLYRVEITGAGDPVRSDMQRLVIMR
jgi:hypothetical protein